MSLLDALTARAESLGPHSALGHGRSAVQDSPDLQRILALDLSPLPEHPIIAQLARPACTRPLWPLQRAALSAAAHMQGLLAPIPVGGGKTLVCALLPTVLDRPRALILTTSKMVEPTRQLIDSYRSDYYIADPQIMSYGMLSRPEQSTFLREFKPDLIILDEAQNFSNRHAARTGRFLRYMRAYPNVLLCALSGSITRTSLQDYGHLAALALRQGSPLPLHWPTLVEWSEALDADRLRSPGALKKLQQPGDKNVRQAYARRLRNTRGVVMTETQSYDGPLTVHILKWTTGAEIQRYLKILDSYWMTPDGRELAQASEVALQRRAMRLGYYYRELLPSTEDTDGWRIARANYSSLLRSFLAHRKRDGLDTPALVQAALMRADARVETLQTAWDVWQTYRDVQILPGNTVSFSYDAQWIVRDWRQLYRRGMIWIGLPQLGVDCAPIKYWGASTTPTDQDFMDACASWRAFGVGRNLQHIHNAMVLGVPTQGAQWEQLIGRHHRPGQTRPVHIYILERELDDYRAAQQDARYIEETTGMPQKILHCEETTHA